MWSFLRQEISTFTVTVLTACMEVAWIVAFPYTFTHFPFQAQISSLEFLKQPQLKVSFYWTEQVKPICSCETSSKQWQHPVMVWDLDQKQCSYGWAIWQLQPRCVSSNAAGTEIFSPHSTFHTPTTYLSSTIYCVSKFCFSNSLQLCCFLCIFLSLMMCIRPHDSSLFIPGHSSYFSLKVWRSKANYSQPCWLNLSSWAGSFTWAHVNSLIIQNWFQSHQVALRH